MAKHEKEGMYTDLASAGAALLASGGLAAGVVLVSSLVGSASRRRQKRRERRAKATQFGIKAADIQFASDRALAMIPSKVAAIQRNSALVKRMSEKAQASAEAEIRVQAAQAGVTGNNIDVQIADTERSLAETNYSVNRQSEREQKQLEINIVDQRINSETAKGTYIDNAKSTKGTDIALAGLSFLSTYAAKL